MPSRVHKTVRTAFAGYHVLATLLKPDRRLPIGFNIEFLAGVAGDTDLDSHPPVAARWPRVHQCNGHLGHTERAHQTEHSAMQPSGFRLTCGSCPAH